MSGGLAVFMSPGIFFALLFTHYFKPTGRMNDRCD